MQVGGYRRAITQSKCSSNLENQKGTFLVFLLEDDALYRKCLPLHMAGRVPWLSLSPVTPVGLSVLFGALSPTICLDSKSTIRAVGALLANDAVVQSYPTHPYATPRLARRALRLAPFCHSFIPLAQQSFVVGPSAVRRGYCPSSSPQCH
jgi:hypothetical protein